MFQVGDSVRVLTPAYVAGEIGTILGEEMLEDSSKTGYWLVQIESRDIILALLPDEIEPFG